MSMYNDNAERNNMETPAELRSTERLLDRLGACERASAPFGMEDRIVFAAGELGRSLDALAAAERNAVDAEFEGRVYAAAQRVVGRGLLRSGEAVPAGLEDRIFQATRSAIRSRATPLAPQRSAAVVIGRIGTWSARLAAVLVLGGGVWLAWTSYRDEPAPPGVSPPVLASATAVEDEDLSFDEFDTVLESHLAFMRTVEYRPADVDTLGEDWCTPCELIEIEEEISS